MTNPINEIISKQKSFTYFHTRVLNREILDRAKQAKKSLEIDLSIDKNGKPYPLLGVWGINNWLMNIEHEQVQGKKKKNCVNWNEIS